jgi:hypothetical protein
MLTRNGFFTYATMRKLEGGGGSNQIADIAKDENLLLSRSLSNVEILKSGQTRITV